MKIATWNVNSVRARLEHLDKWIGRASPDVLCLQETKVVDGDFPREPLEALGYACHFHGQKSYNGVAILTKFPAADVTVGLAHLPADHPLNCHCRVLAATIQGVRVISAYMPNGEDIDSPKYPMKLEFFGEMRHYLEKLHKEGDKILLCGDFNVALTPLDLYNPEAREGRIHFSEPEKLAFQNLLDYGLVDLFRQRHPEPGRYSWWDYRGGGYFKQQGMRLDYMFATKPLANLCQDCDIDESPRRWPKPSDHAPVFCIVS